MRTPRLALAAWLLLGGMRPVHVGAQTPVKVGGEPGAPAAGGLAGDVPLSAWFLVIASFGSLFMVAGKRYSEILLTGGGDATRRSLAEYSDTYLRFVWSSSAAVVLLAYCLWASEVGSHWRGATGLPWAALSIAPFAVALLRYALQIDRGDAGAPEEVLLGDRTLQLLGLAWVTVFSLGVLRV